MGPPRGEDRGRHGRHEGRDPDHRPRRGRPPRRARAAVRRRARALRRGRARRPVRRGPHPPRLRPLALSERTGGVLLAALTAVAVGITYTDQAALVPLLKSDLRISDVQAGFLPTALFISAVVTMLATATLADRIGAKRMNVFGVAFSLASNLLFAVGPTYETLLLAKAVGGIGSGMAFVGGVRYIAGLYPGARSHFGQGLYRSEEHTSE